jgi:hypothetical protein
MTPGEILPLSGEFVPNKDRAVSRMEAATPMTTEAGSMPFLAQRLFSEWLGTAFLLAAVVGSGIMAAKLAGGNGAVALLCNTLATGAIWIVLISVFGSLSGAHFNPAVSLAFALRGALPWRDAATSPRKSWAALSAYGRSTACLNYRYGSSQSWPEPALGSGLRRRLPLSD